MTLLTQDLLLSLIIPFFSIYIRLCLEKWEIIKSMMVSKYKILNNLGYCFLCFYTWINLFGSCLYSLYTGNYLFILITPVYIVISLMIQFKYFEF
jgi:hypothetical protein